MWLPVRDRRICMVKASTTYPHHFQTNQLETTLLKPLDDFPDETTLHSIRLHSNESLLRQIWCTW